MKKLLVSSVSMAIIFGLLFSVASLTTGAPSQTALASSEGNFDRVQITAVAEGMTTDSRFFEIDADRTNKRSRQNGGGAVSWSVGVSVDGVGNFATEGPNVGLHINISAGRATLNTTIEGCGVVAIEWKITGKEFRFDNSFVDGLGGDIHGIDHVKIADASGTVCGLTIGTVDNAFISEEKGRCQGFSDVECDDIADEWSDFAGSFVLSHT